MTAPLEDQSDNEGFSFWAHLPGILLKDGITSSFGEASLSNLDFETWHRLDGEYWEPVNYNDTKPVFLMGALKDGDNTVVIKRVRQLVSTVYQALLLSTRLPLPPPHLSCTYIPKMSVVLPGACGREWIIAGHWKPIRFGLEAVKLNKTIRIYDLLVTTSELWAETEVDAAINTLELSAYPDMTIEGRKINWMNQFVHCIAATESAAFI